MQSRGTVSSLVWLHPRTQLALLAYRALLTHAQPAIDQDPHVPFHGAALQSLVPQSIHISRFAPSQAQNPAPPLVKLHTVGSCPVPSFISFFIGPLCPQGGQQLLSILSLANLLHVSFSPAPKLLTKMLKSTGPRMKPYGSPLGTGLQLDVTPLCLWYPIYHKF